VNGNLGYVLLRPRPDLNLLPDHVPKHNKTRISSYNNRNQSVSVLIYDIFHILQFPTSEQDWERIAKSFEVKCNFPNCLSAVDGKHVAIVPPPGAGSYFFNYKGYNSQVLIGISDSNYEFIYFNFGTNGRVSDGGVLQYTDFYDKLQNECLKIPESSDVKGRKLPYVFVGARCSV